PLADETVPRPVTPIESVSVAAGGAVPPVNLAETDFVAVIVTTHVLAVPVQAPPQPAKVAPVAGVSVSVTLEFAVSLATQCVAPCPQLIPPPATVPLPDTETESWMVVGGGGGGGGEVPPENEAVTLFAAVIETMQV